MEAVAQLKFQLAVPSSVYEPPQVIGARSRRVRCIARAKKGVVAMSTVQGTETDVFQEAQAALLEKIKKSPELKPAIAKKLLAITKEIEGGAPAIPEDLPAAERIKQGFLNFKSTYFLKNPELYEKLSTGQWPKFMVIACADSRVCPTTILGLQPGEAFMIRNVANMVPAWGEAGLPSTSAALEYAVLHLKVSNILVIGHSKCGGIKALMTSSPDKVWSDYIQDWIKISNAARSSVEKEFGDLDIDAQCEHCERESVNLSLANLLTFPWVKDAVVQNKLALHGGHYSFIDGSFEYWTLDVKKGEQAKFC